MENKKLTFRCGRPRRQLQVWQVGMNRAKYGGSKVELGDGLVRRPLLKALHGAGVLAGHPGGTHVLAEDGPLRHTGHVRVVGDLRQDGGHVVFSAA